MWKCRWNTVWATGGLVILKDGDPIRCERFLDGTRDVLHARDELPEHLGIGVENIPGRGFWQHQHMTVGLRHDVHEGKRHIVLIDLETRHFTAQDFRENICFVIGRRRHRLAPSRIHFSMWQPAGGKLKAPS